MSIAESALGAASKIGPYFSAVSLIPAAWLTVSGFALVVARPWTGAPQWALVHQEVASVSASGLVVGAIVTLLVAFVMHPLQFMLVQILEGYWGAGPVAVWAASRRIRFHYQESRLLRLQAMNALRDLDPEGHRSGPLHPSEVHTWWKMQEAERVNINYPESFDDIMPTRLGNVLRRYEARAGRPYGLSVITVAPHIGLISPPEQVSYLQDQRTQLDLATRLCFTSVIISVMTTVMFARCGWWLLIAIVPYVFAMLFYRGACTVAHHYGNALETLLDLNRWRLYEQLRLPNPDDLTSEQTQNERVEEILSERPVGKYVRYVSPPMKD